MRVSTNSMNSVLLAQTLNVQSDYAKALNQQSSELKSESLAGLSGQAGAVVSLQSDLKASENLATKAKKASSMVEIAYSSITSIADIVSKAKVEITAAISGTVSDVSNLVRDADNWLVDVQTLLNVTMGGYSVFGGSGGQSKPVDMSLGSATGTAYYQGSGTDWALMVDGSTPLTYGVRADATAFQTTITALRSLSSMTATPDTETLQNIFDTFDSALTQLGKLQETLSDQSDSLESVIDAQTDFQLYAESALDSVRAVDVAEATANASQIEVILKASYAALSKVTNLSLTDYLR